MIIDECLNKIEDQLNGSYTGEVQSYYSKWEYDYFYQHKNRYLLTLADIDRYSESQSVIEIGCAPCQFTALLSLVGYKVTGIDHFPERSQELINAFSLSVIKCNIEIENLPLDDNSIETVIMSEVLEHLYINPIFALKEIARIIKPGGLLYLTTDNLYSIRILKRFLLGKSINNAVDEWKKLENLGHRGHIRLYSSKEVKEILDYVGLHALKILYHNYTFSQRSRLIYQFIPKFLYPTQVILATKFS